MRPSRVAPTVLSGVLGLAVGVALSACGSNGSSATITSPVTGTASQGPRNALTVTDSQQRSFTLHPDTVSCGRPTQGARTHGLEAVKVSYTEFAPLRGVDIEVLPVQRLTTFRLPSSDAVSREGPLKAFLFVTAKIPAPRTPHEPPAFENSTVQELRRPADGGTLTVVEASCHPARLELTINGRLGSEYSDPDVTVTGGIDLTGS